jgi:hypothetical protein
MSFAFGRPSCGRALRCVGAPNLRTWAGCLALHCGLCHWAKMPNLAFNVPCVALGRPTCGRALRCVWAPILRTCLALRWAPNLGEAVLKILPPSQNLFLSILQLVFFSLVLPCVDVFVADEFFIWAPILRTLALRCVWAPNLRTCLALRFPTCGRADVPWLRWGAEPTLVRLGRIKKSTSKPKFVLIHPPARLLA